MLLTIALLVIVTSIVAFFAQEFGQLFKKLFAIRGVRLLVPLIFASWLVSIFENWSYWSLIRVKAGLHRIEYFFSGFLPFEMGRLSVVRILLLALFASAPIWISWFIVKRKGHYEPTTTSYCIGYTLWILAAILLILPS